MKYSIILSKTAKEKEIFAADELEYYLKEITKKEILRETMDADVIFSIGDTELLEDFIKRNIVKRAISKNDDFSEVFFEKNETFGNDVYMLTGASDYAIMFGVYELLKSLFGLRIYTDKDYSVERTSPCNKFGIYDSFYPDIPLRSVGMYPVYSQNELYMRRMKLYQAQEKWGVWSHSYFIILPPQEYAEVHPDWYTLDKKALCLSNKGMRDQFTENLKKLILDTPDDIYYMLGQEDNKSVCECPDCMEAMGKYKNFRSALMLEFCNDIVGRINEWSKEACPERKLEFVTFAYLYTGEAPVERTENGWEIIDPTLHTLPNLSVLICPNGATSSYSYFDERNKSCFAPTWNCEEDNPLKYSTADFIYQWKAATDRLNIWSYSANYVDFLAPFLMWYDYDRNFVEYKNLKVQYLFEESAYPYPITNFSELRTFIASELAWDSTQDMQNLIRMFIKNYYEEGYEKVQEYFDFLNAYRETMLNDWGIEAWYGRYLDYEDLNSGKYWPKEFLEQALALIGQAIEPFENIPYSELTEKQWRILGESIPCEYVFLTNYILTIDEQLAWKKIEKVKAVAKHFGMNRLGEFAPLTLEEHIKKWEKQLRKEI